MHSLQILSSWKAAVTPPARLVLSNARIVYADNSRQLTFASWAPSSPEDCLSDIVKILCKRKAVYFLKSALQGGRLTRERDADLVCLDS